MKNCSKEQKRIQMLNVEDLEIEKALSWLSAKEEAKAFKTTFFELLGRNSKINALKKGEEVIGISIKRNKQKKAFILPEYEEEVKNVIDNR